MFDIKQQESSHTFALKGYTNTHLPIMASRSEYSQHMCTQLGPWIFPELQVKCTVWLLYHRYGWIVKHSSTSGCSQHVKQNFWRAGIVAVKQLYVSKVFSLLSFHEVVSFSIKFMSCHDWAGFSRIRWFFTHLCPKPLRALKISICFRMPLSFYFSFSHLSFKKCRKVVQFRHPSIVCGTIIFLSASLKVICFL